MLWLVRGYTSSRVGTLALGSVVARALRLLDGCQPSGARLLDGARAHQLVDARLDSRAGDVKERRRGVAAHRGGLPRDHIECVLQDLAAAGVGELAARLHQRVKAEVLDVCVDAERAARPIAPDLGELEHGALEVCSRRRPLGGPQTPFRAHLVVDGRCRAEEPRDQRDLGPEGRQLRGQLRHVGCLLLG